MQSKFHNDIHNEEVLHGIMVNNGLSKVFKDRWFFYIDETISKWDQDMWIDFRCEYKWKIINIDEKTRFTIPIYSNEINYTFSLELCNCSSWKIGWFIDKKKMTDFYLLIYPILNKEIKNKRDYILLQDTTIKDTDVEVLGVMGQLLCVNKLREYIWSKLNKEELIHFINNCKTTYWDKTLYYDLEFKNIDKQDRWDIYITYSPTLSERPINLIIKQWIYDKLREFEFHIPFKKS